MENLGALVRERRSVRTYDGAGLKAENLDKLSAFMTDLENPYGVAVTCKLLSGKEQKLSCVVANGTDLFVGAKAKKTDHMEEAFGYSFERLVLYAQSLGVGTVWVGGTMDRPAFEAAMELEADERMPCMSPLGYPAKKQSIKESLMRKGVGADKRKDFGELFYEGDFETPLTPDKAGELAKPLELVRWAPSAVNKQPWRVVVTAGAVHFYLKHSKGFVSDAVGDMQKIDMGIALCHFDLVMKEQGRSPAFSLADPGIQTPEDTEYIASYRLDA